MKRPSLTLIVTGLFVAYLAHSMWVIYGMFFPTPCPPKGNCIRSYLARNPQLELRIYTSLRESVSTDRNLRLVWRYDNFTVLETVEKKFNVTMPGKTRKNGTLYVHAFLCRRGENPFNSRYTSYARNLVTAYAVPKAQAFNLMGEKENESEKAANKGQPISHWRSKLSVQVMSDNMDFDRFAMPADIYSFVRVSPEGDYLPILYIDELSNRIRDLMPLNESSKEMPLTITYSPISVGKLRMWVNMQQSIKHLMQLGFSEKDTDEVKGIFSDTNFYFLMMTFIVAAFHLLFDFLAFKNDISYWRNRKTMVGLSTRAVVWRCVSTIVIFLYLMDEDTSLLVLVPAGIGTIIEVWKVKKAFKVKISWSGLRPHFELGTASDKEKETQAFDSQAMKYLSYVLYPLVVAGAIYSLIYTPHKSWYSWCIQSLVNGVYAFGFLFMLPQLFVNYKLKSVAHLPWRAFMYKAFNTFIDDIFAFIITMPTAHRLACFRDDVVFVVYLYQRWLYPVDKKRVNEYGQSFDEDEKTDADGTVETKKDK